MGLEDFEWMTPGQFQNVVEQWRKEQERLSKERYEIARFCGWISILPHIKESISPEKIVRFPWEKQKEVIHNFKVEKIGGSNDK